MYKIRIITNFSAAHSLRNYKGKCEGLHGHNWKVEAIISSASLDPVGMVMDFSELKLLTNNILDELDHKHLNELECFKANNPSSEEICHYIFQKLRVEVSRKGGKLEEIRVWETDSSCASYSE